MKVRMLMAAVLTLAGALVAGRADAHPATRTTPAAGSCSRLAILLAGYATNSKKVGPTFATINRQVLSVLGYSKAPILFSYTYPSPYTEDATYNGFPDPAVGSLHKMILDALKSCPNASIDLIGHSLGGAVAMDYLSLYALNHPEGRHIGHVITLDSPVNGSSRRQLILDAALLHLPQAMFDSETGLFLRAESASPNTRYLNEQLVARLSSHMVIRTLASRDDHVVPPADAETNGYSQEFSLGVSPLQCHPGGDWGMCAGHGQILLYRQPLDAIKRILQIPVPSVPPSPIGFRTYHSRVFPYTIAYPTGWHAGGASFLGLGADAFVGPSRDGFATNVNIVAQKVPAGASLDDYVSRVHREEQLFGFRQAGPDEQTAVAGHSAVIDTGTGSVPLLGSWRYRSYIFLAGGRGWQITLSSAPSAGSRYDSVLRAMVGSFRLAG